MGEEGLLSILGSSEQHIKKQELVWWWLFFWFPVIWLVGLLGVYLQQTMPEIVEHAESGLLPS